MIAEHDPRAALREAVARLLRASARTELAVTVEAGDFELCEASETWQIGGRDVLAQRFALIVEPEAFAALQRCEADVAALRDATASVVRSFGTELLELQLFVRLDRRLPTWGHAYRSAPIWVPEEPQPEAVRHAAQRLADALAQPHAAAILGRASLQVAPMAELGDALRRWVIRLAVEDYVAVDRSPELASQLEAAIRAAAANPCSRVAEVSFAVA